MNVIEFMIALLLTLFAWVANEVIFMFTIQPESYLVMIIYAEEDPVISRTSPGLDYARTGLIYGGTFELGDGPIISDNLEWWEIRISPFSPHIVWIPIDYDIMHTQIINSDKFARFGADKIWH